MIKNITELELDSSYAYVVVENANSDNNGDVYFYEGYNSIVNLKTGDTEYLGKEHREYNVCTTKDEVLDLLLKNDIIDKSGLLLIIKSNEGVINKFKISFDVFDIENGDDLTDATYKENLSNIPISIARAMDNTHNCVRIQTKNNNVIFLNATNTLYIVAAPLLKKCNVNVYAAFDV